MDLPKLNDWPPGTTLPRGDHLQQAVAAIRYLADADALCGRPAEWRIAEVWTGVLVSQGPNGEPDFPNAMYWAQRTGIVGGLPTDLIDLIADAQAAGTRGGRWPDDPSFSAGGTLDLLPSIFPATNMAELRIPGGGAHGLTTDGTQAVIVMAFLDRGADQKRVRYLFSSGGGGGPIPCNLHHNGGSNGVAGVSAATYRYDAYRKQADGTDGALVGTSLDVTCGRARVQALPVNLATFGFAYLGADGTYHLSDCNETWGTACPPP